jgi:hypothetical protein
MIRGDIHSFIKKISLIMFPLFATGVVDTGGKFFTNIVDTGCAP